MIPYQNSPSCFALKGAEELLGHVRDSCVSELFLHIFFCFCLGLPIFLAEALKKGTYNLHVNESELRVALLTAFVQTYISVVTWAVIGVG